MLIKNFKGKGFYIWQIRRCESGVPETIANKAQNAGLSHVLIKIADGTEAYNFDPTTGIDLVPPVVSALRNRDLIVLGWHYVYGYDPNGEAEIAIQRIRELDLDGYVIDAESQYKLPGRDQAARQFMSRLRDELEYFPIALSSYRYPSLHPQLPWREFLEKCDYNMPQVYWVENHNPGDQLIRSIREFESINPYRPIIPTGSAYKQGDWEPSSADIIEFLNTARNQNLAAANFWEWGHTKLYLPELWNTVAEYHWPIDPSEIEILVSYFTALNSHDPDQVISLYKNNAVHVTSDRTVKGLPQIRSWYKSLFKQLLPDATFSLIESSSSLGERQFTWTALSNSGMVNNGSDSIGLIDNKIIYHYTYFTIT